MHTKCIKKLQKKTLIRPKMQLQCITPITPYHAYHALLAGVLCTWPCPILLPYGWCVLAVLALSEDVEKKGSICSICSIWHVSRAVLAIWGLGSFAFGSFDPCFECFDPWGHYSDANVQKCAVQSSSVKEEIECKQVEELGRIAWTEQTWLKSCNWYLTVQTLLSSSTLYHYDPLHNECIRTVYLISSYTPHIIYIWYRFAVSSFCF